MREMHGLTNSPEYVVWQSMRGRCLRPRTGGFSRYGGRGIGICARWDSFLAFLADMGTQPSPKHSLERNDLNADYGPVNCRWALPVEQQRHKCRQLNNTSGFTGVTWDRSRLKWTAWIKINRRTKYLGGFENIEDAIACRKNAEAENNFHPQHGVERDGKIYLER